MPALQCTSAPKILTMHSTSSSRPNLACLFYLLHTTELRSYFRQITKVGELSEVRGPRLSPGPDSFWGYGVPALCACAVAKYFGLPLVHEGMNPPPVHSRA